MALSFKGAHRRAFADIPHSFHQTVNGDHGRIEVRRYWLVSELDWLAETPAWAGLHSLGMVEAERCVGELVETPQIVDYIDLTLQKMNQAASSKSCIGKAIDSSVLILPTIFG